MEPTRWETLSERATEFLKNAWELWEISNQDQRWFLIALIGLVTILSVHAIAHLYWRIANRGVIRKAKHHHSMQSFIKSDQGRRQRNKIERTHRTIRTVRTDAGRDQRGKEIK